MPCARSSEARAALRLSCRFTCSPAPSLVLSELCRQRECSQSAHPPPEVIKEVADHARTVDTETEKQTDRQAGRQTDTDSQTDR
eukprot:1814755-Rhodomonas_salina.1